MSRSDRLGAVVLVGGFGTRLHPLSFQLAKPLMPLAGRPALDYALDQLQGAQVGQVVLAAGYAGEQFRNYVEERRQQYSFELHLVVEESPQGTGGALRMANQAFTSPMDQVIGLNGDTFLNLDLTRLLDFHRQQSNQVSMAVCQVEDVANFGQVFSQDSRLSGFEEKGHSRGPGWVNAGSYIFERGLLDSVPLAPSSLERDLFPDWLQKSVPIGVLAFEEKLLDIGTLPEYLRANFLALANHVGFQIRARSSCFVSQSATVDPSVQLRGHYWIGDHCQVAEDCVLENAVLGSGCRVGEGSQIRRSVLWNDCQLGSRVQLEEAILGEGSQVPSHHCVQRQASIPADRPLLAHCDRTAVGF